ncbi:putative TIP120-family protein TIP120B [Papiliotrema laurentii]|uniref:TIP120-family protein TIP120B n=1 Tax=Papiliotrema laurentii TaxID=5418 RepID=A0AAD9FTJ8_PAPLA|nr:putative TIP120-family protein TIP120B [Papiliotrema laurentii]
MSIATRSKISSSYGEYKKKFEEADFDLRQQALYDLGNDIRAVHLASSTSKKTPDNTYADEHVEKQFTNDVLQLVLHDSNSGVKNEAVKCLETMTAKSRPNSVTTIIRGLLEGLVSSEEETRDIACPALKRVIQAIPDDTAQLSQNIDLVIKKVFAILTSTSPSPDPQIASELLQILKDIFLRFPDRIAASPDSQSAALSSLISILSTSRNNSIRKRATEAVPALISTNPSIFSIEFPQQLEAGLRQDGDVGNAWIGLVAALAKEQTLVAKLGGMVTEGKIINIILEHTADTEQVDSVEAALVTIESLILRCPTEISPYIPQILQRALELVRYDPNYVELSDDDVDMNGDDDDEDDDFEEDAYSDEEDLSWKIRRSAAKVLYALIGTRNELIVEFFKTAAPVLIARFSEREDSVRLEILSAVEALLKQTAQARAADAAANGRNKRKRSEGMDEDVSEETALKYLTQSHGQLLSATLKQLKSKNVQTRQQCFVLLRQADEALNGGLEGEADAICEAAASAVRSVDSATSSSLAMAALSFLASFFRHHSARVYAAHLNSLVPAIIRCMKDNLQRVNFEAFNAASALAQSLRPQGSASPLAVNYSSPIQQLFQATTETLGDSSVDGEVRERAMETLGHLLVHEGDALTSSFGSCLPLITARLGTETTALTAVNVIGRIAESPLCKGPEFESWLLDALPEVVVALRKTRRSSSKNAEFACLQSILSRVGRSLPTGTAEALVAELKPFIDAPLGLSTISLILSLQPSARSAVERQILPQVYELVKTPSIHPQAVDALAGFFGTFVEGEPRSVNQLAQTLVANLGGATQLPDATQGGTSIYATTARCIGTAVQHSQGNGQDILASFQQTIKSNKGSEADTYLALLCVGEIGRSVDLSANQDLFAQVLGYFDNGSEEVRSAAAFAAGNLAVGAPQTYLPPIVNQIQSTTSEAQRLLVLHALKEVILHSPAAQLESLADSLWQPLFAEVDTTEAASKKSKKPKVGGTDIGDDGIRNVKAACIGKLTTTAPAKYLPQLQSLLQSSPRNRAIVAAAVRYTFIDTSSAYDELIAPIIIDFLSLMHDENLIVRRLSLASLNAALQNKPHLVIDRLATLQPFLYQETVVKPELQREVQMGPFKMVEDDGLENRKTAYETMYTLLGTCFTKVDIPTFTDRVIAALKDVNEVKVLGLMLLLRLGQLAPASIIPRLDEVAESLKVIMKDVEVKEDTVKQDLERKEEMQRSTLRTAVPLYRISGPAQAPVFHAFVNGLLAKNEWKEYRDYEG